MRKGKPPLINYAKLEAKRMLSSKALNKHKTTYLLKSAYNTDINIDANINSKISSNNKSNYNTQQHTARDLAL